MLLPGEKKPHFSSSNILILERLACIAAVDFPNDTFLRQNVPMRLLWRFVPGG
jgi:hypothetical protein